MYSRKLSTIEKTEVYNSLQMVKGLDSFLSKRKKKPISGVPKKKKQMRADKSFTCLELDEARQILRRKLHE